jgi:hypothetical protein
VFDFFKVTATSLGTRTRVLLAQLRGVGATGEDDNAEPYDGAEVLHPAGFISRPALSDTLEGVGVRDGDEIFLLGLLDKGLAALSSLVEGEVRVFGLKALESMFQILDTGDVNLVAKDGQKITIRANNATVVVDTNGDVIVTPKSGQKVKLGGGTGTQPAPLGTDLNSYLTDLKTAINALRTDVNTIKSHTHTTSCTAGGASVPLSLDLSSLPTASTQGNPPALSATTEVKP